MAEPALQNPEHSPEYQLEWELIELIEEHGSERAALKALLHDFHLLLADADRSVSRGYLRGLFSAGARPISEPES